MAEGVVQRDAATGWQDHIVASLADAGVTVAAFVPDTRLQGVITGLAERSVTLRSLTREEECVAYAAGQGSPAAAPSC